MFPLFLCSVWAFVSIVVSSVVLALALLICVCCCCPCCWYAKRQETKRRKAAERAAADAMAVAARATSGAPATIVVEETPASPKMEGVAAVPVVTTSTHYSESLQLTAFQLHTHIPSFAVHPTPQSPVYATEAPPSYYHPHQVEIDQHQQGSRTGQQSTASKLKDKTVYLAKDAADKTVELAGKTADKTVELTGKTVDAVKGLVSKNKDGGGCKDEYKEPL